MSDNSITLVGNITAEPTLRFTATGRAVSSLSVAVAHRYQSNGEWVEQTSFFNVAVWGETGENVAASAMKGTRVIVSGRLEQREYTTKSGEKRTAVEVIADEVGLSLRWATAQVERKQPNADTPPYEEPF